MPVHPRNGSRIVHLGICVVVMMVAGACGSPVSSPAGSSPEPAKQPPAIPPYTIGLDGLTIPDKITPDTVDLFFCLDTSGSMSGKIDGMRKIDISKNTLNQVFEQIGKYTKDHPDRKVKVGLCTFDAQVTLRQPLAPFDLAKLRQVVQPIQPNGSTSIGTALSAALGELLKAGDETKAILVMTDGANTTGVVPEMVVQAIRRNTNSRQISTSDVAIFLVAFDVAAEQFADVKRAGAEVVESRDKQSLDAIMGSLVEKVLLEAS